MNALIKIITVAAVYLFLPACVVAQEHEHHHAQTQMQGFYGNYPFAREASGTSWQPEAAGHDGTHFMRGDWMFMVHGYATGIYDYQQGERGDEETFSTSMFMAAGQRQLLEGTFGVRTMLSLDPAMGPQGYPLLLQSGETADGEQPLIDRQHPHDLFMELAATYSRPVGENRSVFVYTGLPGEPALGPPAFMHRFSGVDNPEAPLSHHWLDSTHITFGVVTLGFVLDTLKFEGSAFRGREPDEDRWDIEAPELDSSAARLSWNPNRHWSWQISYGALHSPEQLHPDTDVGRFTASGAYHTSHSFGEWQTMVAWGRNDFDPGATLDAFLLESALRVRQTNTFFTRLELLEKNELFREGDELEEQIFDVSKISAGFIHDFPAQHGFQFGVGGVLGVLFLSDELESFYGQEHPISSMLFVRVKI